MWFQEPASDLPTPIPVPVEEPEQVGPITDRSRMLGPPPAEPAPPPPPQRFEPLSAPPEPMLPQETVMRQQQPQGARARGMVGLMLGLGALSLFLVVFFSVPREIVAMIPQTLPVYEALGMQVNTVGFKIVANKFRERANGIPIVVIKGELLNETDSEQAVPRVKITVRDRNKRELYHWIVRADQDNVGPRGKATFSARLESPPAGAADVEVRVAREGER